MDPVVTDNDLVQRKVEQAVLEIDKILRTNEIHIELLGIDPAGVVRVLVSGDCPTCGNSMMTLERGIERMIREQVPEVKQVVISRPLAS